MKNPAVFVGVIAILSVGCVSSELKKGVVNFGEFKISQLDIDSSIVVSSDRLGSVYINQYADHLQSGLSLMVLNPDTSSPVLEVLDIDGDGYWDTVRYVVASEGRHLRIEDNNGDGEPDQKQEGNK